MPERHRFSLGLLAVLSVGTFALALVAPLPGRVGPTRYLLPTASLPRALDPTAHQEALATTEDERISHAAHVAKNHHLVFVVPSAAGLPTLVLPARTRPYRLDLVAAQWPAYFTPTPAGLLVRLPVLVLTGARLVVDSHRTPTVLLAAGPQGFTSLVADGGAVALVGHVGARLHVTSFDLTARRPDSRDLNGRPYLLDRGGTMQLTNVDVDHLGFGPGRTSGVAWLFTRGTRPGGATGSTFVANRFGGYSFEASYLRFDHDVFDDNEEYGLDPHDQSSNLLIENSVADRNGKHGFIVSRGCSHVVFRDDVARYNREAGFLIDDGRVAADGDARHAVAVPSDAAVLDRDLAYGNGLLGIGIQNGAGTLVTSSETVGGRFGIWVKNGATGTRIVNTVVHAATASGIFVFGGATGTTVQQVTVHGGRFGVTVAGAPGTTVRNAWLQDARVSAIRLAGTVTGTQVRRVQLTGTGPLPVDLHHAVGLTRGALWSVRTDGWVVRYRPGTPTKWMAHHPQVFTWVPVLGIPLPFWLAGRRRPRFDYGRLPSA